MKNKIMISLSGRNQAWFDKLSKRDQKEYLKAHPNSKFGKAPAKAKKTEVKPEKKVAKKKTAAKGVQRKSKPAAHEVHHDTSQLHSHAVNSKKKAIDKLVAPYAKQLRLLRNKRDAGEGLTHDENKRYKQLLITIAHLHNGR